MAKTRKVKPEHWPALKADLKKKWNQLSDAELDQTEGKEHSLLSLLERKLGMELDKAGEKLDEMTSHYQLADIEDEPMR